MRDRDVRFHSQWLGLVQPIEGLMFSIPVLADAQIAPEVAPDLSAAFEVHVVDDASGPRIRDLREFFRVFLGYDQPGMLVPLAELPATLSFYAAEGGQEIRPSFALGRGPFTPNADSSSDDPFAAFAPTAAPADTAGGGALTAGLPLALIWDLTESGASLDLDRPETQTGPWRYPPTQKFERLLRHAGVPVGLLSNGHELRLVYAPAGETPAHLTFRVNELQQRDGRPVVAALELLLHARRAYTAAPAHTLEGLLAESRRRQADVTSRLASQVFEAVELLVAGFEAAAARDAGAGAGRLDWLRPALEAEGDHFYEGVLSVVLRIVFLLYAEDQGLLPVDHPTYDEHLSLFTLYERLSQDAGGHPESMHHRFGAYGQLLALFRAVFFGVKHGGLDLPPRRGRLFDPNAYPFLEGGQPDWTAAVTSPAARAAVQPPSLDDGTIHRVLHRLMVFEGQRLSYRTLDVEQIGSIYESLMGYHVLRLESPAVRLGKHGVWVEVRAIRDIAVAERPRLLKDTCGLGPGPIRALEEGLKEARDDDSMLELLSAVSGRRADSLRHRSQGGRLVLQPGEERRRTGSHYTPRALTEKVVRRTLEPLLACLGEGRTVEQILQLKICDPAMGSGAFLVAACRQLADEVVQAWTRAGVLAAMIEEHGDAHLHARRLVAQRCLYGVDKNAAAVELAKLSLWLVTLSRQLPFTFVDHALRHGDSLIGLDFKQIRAFHWKPSPQIEFCERVLGEELEQAVALRQEILALAEKEDPYAQAEKRRLLEWSRQAIERVRLVADVCVGAFFAADTDAARESERLRRLTSIERWLSGDDSARAGLEEMARQMRKIHPPFHWWIELPEVFFEQRPDPLQTGLANGAAFMEAVVGNPPFMSGSDVSTFLGKRYSSWLYGFFEKTAGKTDLCAYFFRRAGHLLGNHGVIGLLGTKTISEGDSRVSGLSYLVENGMKIAAATRRMPWPGDASVTVSIVHLAKGRVREVGLVLLDDHPVQYINSRLEHGEEQVAPIPLEANQGIAFHGWEVGGEGFVLSEEERARFLKSDRKNREKILPFMGGEDLTTSPTQSPGRFVIAFWDDAYEEAARWPELLDHLRREVYPIRQHNNREAKRKYWWRFAERQPSLSRALQPLRRCLAISSVAKHLVFSFCDPDVVFSDRCWVFAVAACIGAS